MEIKLDQDEVFKLFKDSVPVSILPAHYVLVGMRIEGPGNIQKEASVVLVLEKKNGEQKAKGFVPINYEGGGA